MPEVYLDHQSTTPVLPEVFEAMKPWFMESFGNPSSLHRHGLRARDAMARAREEIAALINAASPEEILFTSGGTESANLAVKGTAATTHRPGSHIVLSRIEHPSVIKSVEALAGFTSTRVEVDAEGWIDPAHVRAAVTDQTCLICVHHANHDIGTLEPIREIADIAGERGIPLFVDAVATGGWVPIDVRAMGASLLSLSPHRFHGPKGVGILYRSRRARLRGQLDGGVQEGGLRAGTENVPAIVGAGVAAGIAVRELPRRMEITSRLQRRLLEGLRGRVSHLKLNGPEPGERRLSTNLNLSAEFTEGEGQALLCDLQGISIASGASCVSKALKISHVLEAIGLDPALAQASVILSLGQHNTGEEMDHVIQTFPKVIQRLRDLSPRWESFRGGGLKSVLPPSF